MEFVSDFNNILLDFTLNIAHICPNSLIGKNVSFVEKHINQLNNPKSNNYTKLIDLFVEKVLVYKDKIDAGDEDFFLKKEYDNDLNGQSDLIGKVFEFKSIWRTLTQENKDCVIQYMQILCKLAQNYFMKTYN